MKTLLKSLLVAAALLLSSSAFAQLSCATHVVGELPTATKSKPTLLCRKSYDLLYDMDKRTPLASMEKLDGKFCADKGRTNAFQPDPNLPAPKAQLKDYVGQPYDRGHLTNDLDQRCDLEGEKQTFYLSNMVPQVPSSNRGQWKALEGWVRKASAALGETYVISGPIFEGEPKTIGDNAIPVPSHLYKVVYFTKLNRAAAFIVPNAENNANYRSYAVALSEVERRANLTLFRGIPNLNHDDVSKDLIGSAK